MKALMDGGLPPFSAHPALNLVFLESCHAGADVSNSYTYLYPYDNGYGKHLENQAKLGCNVFFLLNAYRRVASDLFQKLCGGPTILSATHWMIDSCRADHVLVVQGDNQGAAEREPTYDDFPIFGNEYTTIKNVYNPNIPDRSIIPWQEIDQSLVWICHDIPSNFRYRY